MVGSWTFQRKLGTGFAAVVLLTLAMAAIAFVTLRTVVDRKDVVIDVTSRMLIDSHIALAANENVVASSRGYLLTGADRFLTRLSQADSEFEAAFASIRELGLTPQGERLVAAVEDAADRHRSALDSVIERRRAGAELGDVVEEFEQRVIPERDALRRAVTEFIELEESVLREDTERASDAASQASALVLGIGAAALVVAAGIAFLLARILGRQIGTSVQHVRSSTVELQAAASQQAAGAREQATAMNEITTTIGELLTTSRQIAEGSRRVAQIASETAASARTGDEAVRNAQESVASIKRQVEIITRHMLELGRKSQRIGGILEIINELSEQTNILAINATIEAAGAGEAGRRFAVVGEEIRKLADRVGSSTRDIRELIEEIRSAVNSTVMATEAGSKTVDAGGERIQELASAFQRIGKLVETTTDASREIELSTKQQASAVEQVNVAISSVAQTTKEAEAGSSQTLQTASQLATLSNDLARLIQAHQAA